MNKDTFIAIAAALTVLGLSWYGMTKFADAMDSYEIIEPEDGIHCVVVSRMVTTSVACWKVQK